MKAYFLMFLLLLLLAIHGCTDSTASDEQQSIVATIYPIQDLAQEVIGNSSPVVSLVPPGSEPHSYEPTPKQIAELSRSKVFLTIGLEFQELEQKLIAANPGLKVIRVSDGIALIESESGTDPHVWLSPKNAIIVSRNIRDGMVELDPGKAEIYISNYELLLARLKSLDQDYSDGLKSCTQRVIITNHRAFAYMARDYNFSQLSIAGLEPESEPKPSQIREILDIAKVNSIKYIYYETQVSDRVARSIADQIGAQVLLLDHVNAPVEHGDSYITIMRRNLENLRIGMECE